MSKSLYLNKTERLGMHLNIALAFYNFTLAPHERERQGSQRGWLSCAEIPEEIMAFFEPRAEGIEYRRLL